ncbi:MAG: TolC family protein [bacterium]|nr:TolC family protein [bacterium]
MERWTRIAITAVLLAAWAPAGALPAQADETTVPLATLEQQISGSLTLAAAKALIDEDEASLQVARDKAGLAAFATNELGPHHDVVTDRSTRSFLRYEQEAGIRVPMLGARALQQQEIAMALGQRTLGELAYEQTRVQVLAKARASYIEYLTARRLERLARGFFEGLNGNAPAALALHRNGFWTGADRLRYNDLVERTRVDVARAQVGQRNALLQLALVTGSPLDSFAPVEPRFAGCATTAAIAFASAVRSDIELAKLAAEASEARAVGRLQRWMGYDANLYMGLRTYVDTPGGLGAGFVVGLDLGVPVHVTREQLDLQRRVAAELRQYDLLAEQRRAELAAGVEIALTSLKQASVELAQARRDDVALQEDVREARVRFALIAPNTLTELQAKAEAAYRAQIQTAQDEGAVLLRINDLLQIAPAACDMKLTAAPDAVGGVK